MLPKVDMNVMFSFLEVSSTIHPLKYCWFFSLTWTGCADCAICADCMRWKVASSIVAKVCDRIKEDESKDTCFCFRSSNDTSGVPACQYVNIFTLLRRGLFVFFICFNLNPICENFKFKLRTVLHYHIQSQRKKT